MKPELVESIIRTVSAHNERMRVVLEAVRVEARDEIARYPDTPLGVYRLAKGMVLAVSRVIGGDIDFKDLRLQGGQYWETDQGKINAVKVGQYADDLCHRISEIKTSRVNI
jgi:hypothetical protein